MRMLHLAPLFLIAVLSGCRFDHKITDPVEVGAAESEALHGKRGRHDERGRSGAVYVISNATSGNAVIAFPRNADGSLGTPSHHPTRGTGTGGGLGNQGGVILSADGEWLFAVNAGSDEISTFRVHSRGLSFVGNVASGGIRPVSLTVHGDLLFVLNAGGEGNITGFNIRRSGHLTPLRRSTRPLSGPATMPAQIGFTPDGDHLVVTERATNLISVYRVDDEIHGPHPQPSSGVTPFGFAFAGRGNLIVSEAFGGAVDGSAVSSYHVKDSGRLRTLSPSVPTTETAACWIAVSGDGRYAYATNTGSNSVTGYRVGHDGSLSRLAQDGVSAVSGAGPVDAAFGSGRYLYVRNGSGNSISAYRWMRDGSLEALGETDGLPTGANGLAAR